MKKICLLFILSTIVSLTLTAQKKPWRITHFSLGADIGFPLGNDSDFYKAIIGGSFEAEFPVTKKLSITAHTAFQSYTWNNKITNRSGSSKVISLMGGTRYYIRNFYLSAQVGSIYARGYGLFKGLVYSPGI